MGTRAATQTKQKDSAVAVTIITNRATMDQNGDGSTALDMRPETLLV